MKPLQCMFQPILKHVQLVLQQVQYCIELHLNALGCIGVCYACISFNECVYKVADGCIDLYVRFHL